MPFIETGLQGLLVFEPMVFEDSRGFFFEAFNQHIFRQHGILDTFVQDNQSKSVYGVIRGLHYQLSPYAQAKLVRVLSGRVLDVGVDIRKGSPTYGKHFSIELSADNKKQMYLPPGFAHGFSVLSPDAEVLYKCSAYYNKASEAGILYSDSTLAIDWKVPLDSAIISDKDVHLPSFLECKNNFQFEG